MTIFQAVLLGVAGLGAGVIAGLVGVGGGVGLVPAYNRWLRLPMHRAVGTSSATIVLISTLSTIAYAVLGAQAGAALAHRFETRWLRWSFAVLAVVVAGRLLWGAFGG